MDLLKQGSINDEDHSVLKPVCFVFLEKLARRSQWQQWRKW